LQAEQASISQQEAEKKHEKAQEAVTGLERKLKVLHSPITPPSIPMGA